ncbi:hypothetical protein LHJ74_26645 [Streptomyces sp. N2-109]|uniref:Lipoprotein n=1 Tax=Streptomyces gossypii TaxID=2883101 RepID=A0ABT2JZU5_9ACTN|nr:hypothetical protein [Streptomyces gossypii]MCT2593442.1 hypothetical protein [Streptomyces gossypii]
MDAQEDSRGEGPDGGRTAVGEEDQLPARGASWVRRAQWAVFWAVGAVALAVVAWFAWAAFSFTTSDDPFRTHSEISCSRAMSFAHGELPEGATDEDCSSDEWMDTTVRGTFRMPRAEVGPWLKRSYPDGKPEKYCGQDVCLDMSLPEEPGGAHEVRLDVRYETGGTALVTLEALTL